MSRDWWRDFFWLMIFVILFSSVLWLIGRWLGWGKFESIGYGWILIALPYLLLSFTQFGIGKKIQNFVIYGNVCVLLPFVWLHYRILRSITDVTPEPWYLIELFGRNTIRLQQVVLPWRPWSLSNFYLALKGMHRME